MKIFKAGPLQLLTYKNTKGRKFVSNKYTLIYSMFIHSDCGSSSVNTYTNKPILLEEKKVRIVDSNHERLSHRPSTLATVNCAMSADTQYLV